MADVATSDTIEITQEQASNALTEVSTLLAVLGANPVDGPKTWDTDVKQGMDFQLASALAQIAPARPS